MAINKNNKKNLLERIMTMITVKKIRTKITTTSWQCMIFLLCFGLMITMSSCASDQLKAPCPNFGARCKKSPVNGWDDN